jgi:hypothetical protein
LTLFKILRATALGCGFNVLRRPIETATVCSQWGGPEYCSGSSGELLPIEREGYPYTGGDPGNSWNMVLVLFFENTLTHDGGIVQLTSQSYEREFLFQPDGLNSGYVTGVTASQVPIPAAVWLFGSALAGLGWLRRKQTV